MLAGKNIIFSLDDFGISQKANDNALKLIETGKMNRVSIMVHGLISPQEISRILASGIKIDSHVDLKNEINPNRKLKDSALRRLFVFALDFFSGKISPVRMEKQWEDQILRFQKLFHRNPDGIGSHEHVHFFPLYFKTLLRLSQKHAIRYIRLGRESYGRNSLVSLMLNWLRRRNLKAFTKSGLSSSDFMVSFDWIKNFDEFIETCPKNKEIEIVFHPERDEEMTFLESILAKISAK